MGEIFVKKNNAFERVVSDGNTVIINGGGGGGSGVTIAFYAYRTQAQEYNDQVLFRNGGFPAGGAAGSGTYGGGLREVRYLSGFFGGVNGYGGRVLTNTNSLGSGQPFNAETGEFTAPVAGVYRFSAMASVYHWAALSDGTNDYTEFSMWLRKNPPTGNIPSFDLPDSSRIGARTFSARDDEQSSSGGANSVDVYTDSGTWEIELRAGDRIRLCGSIYDAFPNSLQIRELTFSGSYVGGASVTPVGPQACFVKSDLFVPSQNGTVTQINRNTLPSLIKVIDTLNEFDPSTGRFTAKTKGIYSVNFTGIGLDGSQGDLTVWMQKTLAGQTITPNLSSAYGGIIVENTTPQGGGSGVGNNTMSKTWLVEMEVGDVLTWYVIASSGGSDGQRLDQISISAHLLTSTQTIDSMFDEPVSTNTQYVFNGAVSGTFGQIVPINSGNGTSLIQTSSGTPLTGAIIAPQVLGHGKWAVFLNGWENNIDTDEDIRMTLSCVFNVPVGKYLFFGIDPRSSADSTTQAGFGYWLRNDRSAPIANTVADAYSEALGWKEFRTDNYPPTEVIPEGARAVCTSGEFVFYRGKDNSQFATTAPDPKLIYSTTQGRLVTFSGHAKLIG